MLNYPQTYPQSPVDKETHRVKCLTIKATQRLYLKLYLAFVKANKNIKKLTAVKNGIVLLIVILTVNQPISANAYNPLIESYKLYAHMKLGNDQQYRCLVTLWTLESHWSATANNTKSSAYGIPQLLHMKTTNPYRQIDLGIKYISHRYNTPCQALKHHKKAGHY